MNMLKEVRELTLLLVTLVLFISPGISNAIDSVVIISIPENQAHQKFSYAFQQKLVELQPDIYIYEKSIDNYSAPDEKSMLVTLGSRALQKTSNEQGVTKLHTLISRSFHQKYYPGHKDNGAYHLVFDQPLERILQLQELALPNSRRIGMLVGSQYPDFITRLSRAIRRTGKVLVSEKFNGEFSKSLANLLSRSDSLLLFPDSSVINRTTINTLVLDSYHKQIPLLGYSKALVKAGAMIALYSTPEQLGEDAAMIASRIIAGKKTAFHHYPSHFKISVNYKLSRVYGLTIPSENELHRKLHAEERR